MKKKMTRLAAMIALAFAANTIFAVDSYLYWMVDPSVSGSYTYDYAKVKIAGGDYLHMYDPGEDVILAGDAGTKLAAGDSGYFGAFDASTLSSASFLIELWSSVGAESIASATLAYSAALAGGAIYTPGSKGGNTPYSVNGFTATIPEPTSGLLLLLGVAGLALKRKSLVVSR